MAVIYKVNLCGRNILWIAISLDCQCSWDDGIPYTIETIHL